MKGLNQIQPSHGPTHRGSWDWVRFNSVMAQPKKVHGVVESDQCCHGSTYRHSWGCWIRPNLVIRRLTLAHVRVESDLTYPQAFHCLPKNIRSRTFKTVQGTTNDKKSQKNLFSSKHGPSSTIIRDNKTRHGMTPFRPQSLTTGLVTERGHFDHNP